MRVFTAYTKNRRLRRGAGVLLAAATCVAVVSGCGGEGGDKAAEGAKGGTDGKTAAPSASGPASPSAEESPRTTPAPTKKAEPTTVLTLKGTGVKETGEFTVGDDWAVSYTYDCARTMGAVDGKGNFIIFEKASGKENKLVNEMGKSGEKSVAQHGAGTRRFHIISECDWTVKVTG
ncbi:hypothetical protein ACGFRB_01050 [Streptomyces sp. NPDC048718]|uniref:hypothetical protein n=1 Tax=Streptomyces sp. NPDC048718 TaxID=3365587 RepID=UPI003714445F